MTKNIKEIGKELLGKSLNSFHRKTGLTQLEKNNEMQDGILDGILSQVDDAYIEKTEQSNVIHLDGSGDGVVVLDSIEGNTMVNLWKGSASLTSNWIQGDLTQEITNKILTVCNLTDKRIFFELSTIDGSNSGYSRGIHVEPNSKLKVTVTSNEKKRMTQGRFSDGWLDTEVDKFKKGVLVLEGNYTDKEINYFEGLQSSFEEKVNDEGKYEIEILMNNKNLLDTSKYIISQTNGSIGAISNNILTLGQVASSGMYCEYQSEFIKVKEETVYSLSSHITEKNGANANHIMRYYDNNKKQIGYSDGIDNGVGSYTRRFTTTKGTKYIKFCIGSHTSTLDNTLKSCKVDLNRVMLKIGDIDTNVVSYKSNKIKLLLDEPLRAVDKFKDRLCIKDNKLVVERNIYSQEISPNVGYIPFIKNNHLVFAITPRLTPKGVYGMCNMFATDNHGWEYIQSEESDNREFCQFYSNFNYIHIKKSRLSSPDTQGVNEWLLGNKVVLVYPLAEPYYEEVLNEYGEPILIEGYENGTLYIDSTIVPTTTVRYTPKMESFKTLKEVENNNIMLTNDVNDNIIPYMMNVDLMIMEKEMALMSHKNIRKMEVLDMTSMQKRTQDMLERLIKGKSLTEQECKTRVTTYLNAGKITDEQAEELMLVIDEVYA